MSRTKVLLGQEELPQLLAIRREGLLVAAHKQALADGGSGLFQWDAPWPLGQPKPTHPSQNGARGDQHHLVPLLPKPDKLTTDPLQCRLVQGDIALGQNGGADLHDQPFYFSQACPESCRRSGSCVRRWSFCLTHGIA